MRRRRTAIIAAVVVVVLAVAFMGFGHRQTPASQIDTAARAPSVPLVTARFGTLVMHVHASGRVGAPAGGDAKLAFSGSGILARVDVHVGESVGAGEPLAELDTSGLGIDVQQARADAAGAAASYGGGSVPARALASAQQRLSIARARLRALGAGSSAAQSDAVGAQSALRQSQAKVAADERTLQREQALYSGGVAAQKDVDAAQQVLALDRADADAARAKLGSASAGVGGALLQARGDVVQAESDVRTAEAQAGVTAAQANSAGARLASARRSLAKGVLRAPADGVVVAILKRPGESVDPTQPAVVVGPPRSDAITVTVTGDAARAIRPGDAAVVTIPARGVRAPALVRAVVPSVDPNTQTSIVVLSGVPPGTASGDAVDATLITGSQRGILVPTEAIVQDPQTGHAVVFVRAKGKNGEDVFVSREIEIGGSDAQTTVVTGGLRTGDRVAGRGAFDLLAPAGGG
jgi:multidrug efflux pump subunit AcrA (membrane-fusion protein)